MAAGLAKVVFGDKRTSVKIVNKASERTSTTLLSEWKRLRRVSGVPSATETTENTVQNLHALMPKANTTCENNRGRLQGL